MENVINNTDGTDEVLPYRELRGLDRTLRTIRGNLAVQESKKVAMQQHKNDYQESLKNATDPERRRILEHDVQKADDEIAAIDESIDRLRGRLKSQVVQIRESISNLLGGDETLGERIKQLFREQGVTIASILTAIGMAISTLVLAITGGGRTVIPSPPKPPPKPPGVKEWIEKQLKTIANFLKQIAGKAAAALPGIIGGVLSWIFKTASKGFDWLAGNLWALLVALGGVLLGLVFKKK